MRRCIALGVLLVVSTFAMQGCADSSRQNSELAYGNASDYTAYGYSDPYADPYAPWPYDPLLYSYWYPQPYYYYRYAGDNDHDCDDGYCGPHEGHRHPPILPRPLAASRPLTTTHESSGAGFAATSRGGFHSGFNGAGGFGGHVSSHR